MTRLQTMTATAPSNIAFIKYWGKRDPKLQWPANDSLSMTLSASKTITQATPNNLSHDTFTFAGATLDSRTSPDHKVFRHIETLRAILGVSTHVDVTSRNTFPTGCGIASSARQKTTLHESCRYRAAYQTRESNFDLLPS